MIYCAPGITRKCSVEASIDHAVLAARMICEGLELVATAWFRYSIIAVEALLEYYGQVLLDIIRCILGQSNIL